MFRSALVVCVLVMGGSDQVRLRVVAEVEETVECTITATDGDTTAVQAAINDASVTHGSTVCIPEGTWNWDTTVTITEGITLRSETDCTLDGATGRATDCPTVIIDDLSGDARLIEITLAASETSRVAHLEIQDGTRGAGAGTQGVIRIVGTNTSAEHSGRFRIDHLVLFQLQGFAIRPLAAYGVIDHITATNTSNFVLYTFANTFVVWSDQRWADEANFGGENFVFFENNSVTRTVSPSFACVDSYSGARVVYRHNDWVNCHIEAHGTESSARSRGTRAIEVYSNTFALAGGEATPVGLRSGTALIYDNTITNAGSNPQPAGMVISRTINDFSPWDIADGASPADNNDAGNPQSSHVATGAGTRTVTVTGAGWTPNALIGYTIRKMTSPCNVSIASVDVDDNEFHTSGPHGLASTNTVQIKNHTGSTPHVIGNYTATVVDADTFTIGVDVTVAGTGGVASLGGGSKPICASLVLSNTTDTITFATAFFGAADDMVFTTGDAFDLNLITEVFDAPGRGRGTDLNGVDKPVLAANDQIDDPIYEWENYTDGVEVDLSARAEYALMIRQNEHFFNDTQKPGYTPYTYPHPLTLTP